MKHTIYLDSTPGVSDVASDTTSDRALESMQLVHTDLISTMHVLCHVK
jgi:hypothetical protein